MVNSIYLHSHISKFILERLKFIDKYQIRLIGELSYVPLMK